MTSAVSPPTTRSLILVPAVITLALTLVRLTLEIGGAPSWLASNAPGGARALLGIVWLPLVFGPWFAARLRPHVAPGKRFWLRLWKTLTLYGFAARVPVVVITIAAVVGNWGTHYEKFGNETGVGFRIGAGFVAQLVIWACIWTPLAGLLSALVVSAFQPRAAKGTLEPSAR